MNYLRSGLSMIFLCFILCPRANSQSFMSRLLADNSMIEYGQDAFNIIEGVNGFSTDFVAIANSVEGAGANLNQQFNVVNYGAINDGSVDATAAINATYVAATAAGGGTVIIPAGDYKIEGQIEPTSNTRTVAVGSRLIRSAHITGGSNAPGSGLVLFENINNFSWTGGEISNSNGLYRGRGVEFINCQNFEFDSVSIYYMGLSDTGSPAPSVGLFGTSSSNFYIHDLYAEASYLGDITHPHPLGNTPFRFAGCSNGIVYKIEGHSTDNIIDLTADNTGIDRTQHDMLVIDVDGHQRLGYGKSSALIVGTAGSQGNHPGSHYNLYFMKIEQDTGGDMSNPLFEVMNSSTQSSAAVYDIHLIGLKSDGDAKTGLQIFTAGSVTNGGINNIYIKHSSINNTRSNGEGLKTTSKVYDIYLDEFSKNNIKGDPDYKLNAATDTIYINNTTTISSPFFLKNRKTLKRIRPFKQLSTDSIVQCPAGWSGDLVKWEKEYISQDVFLLKNVLTGFYMRPETTSNNANIVATDIKDTWALWSFSPTADSYGYLINQQTQKYFSPQSTDDMATGTKFRCLQKPITNSGAWTQWKQEEEAMSKKSKDISKMQVEGISMVQVDSSNKKMLITSESQSNWEVNIYTINGVKLQTIEGYGLSSIIDLDHLASGVYISTIKYNNKQNSKKFIVN